MTIAAELQEPARARHEVPVWRLYALRGLYLLIAVGMGSQIWPLMFHHRPWALMHGVANCMLAAMTALCAVGVRYPLQMLPILFFELIWKTLWLIVVALPIWQAEQPFDADTAETVKACAMGIVIIPIVIPWGYVWRHCVTGRGDRWW